VLALGELVAESLLEPGYAGPHDRPPIQETWGGAGEGAEPRPDGGPGPLRGRRGLRRRRSRRFSHLGFGRPRKQAAAAADRGRAEVATFPSLLAGASIGTPTLFLQRETELKALILHLNLTLFSAGWSLLFLDFFFWVKTKKVSPLNSSSGLSDFSSY
jgi:hypothetical protein